MEESPWCRLKAISGEARSFTLEMTASVEKNTPFQHFFQSMPCATYWMLTSLAYLTKSFQTNRCIWKPQQEENKACSAELGTPICWQLRVTKPKYPDRNGFIWPEKLRIALQWAT